MRTTVLPIGYTAIDWKTFLHATHAALKRSMVAPLDKKSISDRGMASAIVAFGEFQQQHTDYTSVLRDAGPLLRHFSVSFLVLLPDARTLLEIATESDLRVLLSDEKETLCVVTASLEAWRTTLINLGTARATESQREFVEEALNAFERMGLGKLWENYTRHAGGVLTEKRR